MNKIHSVITYDTHFVLVPQSESYKWRILYPKSAGSYTSIDSYTLIQLNKKV